MTAQREHIPYDELTEAQKRAIVEAARVIHHRTYVSVALDDALDAATRDKPKRYVVEVRIPRTGERFVTSTGIDVAVGDFRSVKCAVIVEEVNP